MCKRVLEGGDIVLCRILWSNGQFNAMRHSDGDSSFSEKTTTDFLKLRQTAFEMSDKLF